LIECDESLVGGKVDPELFRVGQAAQEQVEDLLADEAIAVEGYRLPGYADVRKTAGRLDDFACRGINGAHLAFPGD
jgi:hypothetical protein